MKTHFIHHQVLFRLIPVVCVALMLSGGCSSEPPPPGPPIVTKAEADQIKVGMTLEEAQKIIGDPGESIKTPEPAPLTPHTWSNPDGSHLMVDLRDGKIERIQPMNLK